MIFLLILRLYLILTPFRGSCLPITVLLPKVDDRTPQYVRDILERHPSAPFLSLHHEDKVFKASTQVTCQLHLMNT